MARILKQSTSVDVPIGPFLDQSDGFSPETALTITQPDIRLKKNAAAWAQKNAAQTLTHEENGNYEVTLDATDTNTLGLLRLHVNESGALPVWEDFLVVTANFFDSLFSTDLFQVDVSQWLGAVVPATTVAGVPEVDLTHWLGLVPNALSSSSVPASVNVVTTGAISNSSLAADTGLKPVRAATCQAGASGSITLDASASSVDDFYKGLRIYITSGTGAGQSRLCTGYNGTTKIATIEPNWITNPAGGATFAVLSDGYTPAIATGGIASTSFAAGAINAAATNADFLAEVNAEVDTALADYDAPTFAELDARTDAIEADTQDIQARIPAALVSGRIKAIVEAFAAGAIDAVAMNADMNSYTTRTWLAKESTTADKYIVQWVKNGQILTSGITLPKMRVFDESGTDLIAETAMTEIGSTQSFKFEELTNTLTPGEIYMVEAKATIDGSVRLDRQPVMRDSA